MLLRSAGIYDSRIGSLHQQADRYDAVSKITGEESSIDKDDIRQSAERFAANEKLYRDKVISRQEYYDEAARLRQKQLILEGRRKAGIQNRILAGENNKQLAEIVFDKKEKENIRQLAIEEALRNLQNYIFTWKQQYLVVAPFEGTLHYLRPLQVDEAISSGDELFALIPATYHYVARASMPPSGFGKVKPGQEAHLLLEQFPSSEFGYLKGKVGAMSILPQSSIVTGTGSQTNDAQYRLDILLPDSLITTYNERIVFRPEMPARARIITRDRTLLQRLLTGIAGTNQ